MLPATASFHWLSLGSNHINRASASLPSTLVACASLYEICSTTVSEPVPERLTTSLAAWKPEGVELLNVTFTVLALVAVPPIRETFVLSEADVEFVTGGTSV